MTPKEKQDHIKDCEKREYNLGFASGSLHFEHLQNYEFLALENVEKAKKYKLNNSYWLGYYEALILLEVISV